MASVMFTDCSSSTTAAALLLPSSRYRVRHSVLHSLRSIPLPFAPFKPILLRTTGTISHASTSPSIVTGDVALVDVKCCNLYTSWLGFHSGLAVILVGDMKDSATYHMNEQNILNSVCIEKDVDGFHPLNIGRLAMRGREPLFVPCTPNGCIELLHRYGVDIKGRKAVVIGRSNIVRTPAALLLQREDATVSVVHSRTKNPEEITRQADIIIAAVGQANMARGSWIKPGAVVIDVGINPVEDAKSAKGYRLVGDVCHEEVCKIASAITPVPEGVGPMTISMLLSNTLSSAKRMHNYK
ncbi:hypothetical protein RHSIM_RhsimUnG0002200 [Rhododendron simsii]|uniref:Tetrahydrofolate dehydrogenase/cyclohydrolase NAD(P)-binding domain-containing protein n=1 Tax=Rhododendron simsii TaxID=118357 RepID=A0A834G066_RHOSS|nr:hypothetical protein RHSIM_RhsimUnG0002200 [Rhododendron simsii]